MIVFLITLPVVIGVNWQNINRSLGDYPDEIKIAQGPEDGFYRPLSQNLIDTIKKDELLDLKVYPRESEGSLSNLYLLQDGEADFALYQPGTLEPDTASNVRFVANLYSQPAHFIVRRGASIQSPADLRGKRVQLGLENSGDYAMSRILLEHFELNETDVEARHLTYQQVKDGFADESLDAAFITIGVHAKIFSDLFTSGNCELRSIPYVEALMTKQISLSPYTIPKGLYSRQLGPEPDRDITTVSVGAQLLTRKDVNDEVVMEVTRLVMNDEFLKRNQLGELYLSGANYAQAKPAFAMHSGARSFYDPHFDIHIFESLDAIYSLVASVLIATFLLAQEFRKRRVRKKEHRLDRHLRSLLGIERRQIDLDNESYTDDLEALQKLLDEVTFLRQGALEEIAARDLNEDRAIDSFIQMCHALSHKINAKISRQRLDQRLAELIKLLATTGDASPDTNKQE
ncbi:MAG: TAXI family TRAP transporter solute-binding subunit [Fuerstiella sp.]